jgi:hypothetical protein
MESGGRSSSLEDLSGISWTARAEPGNFRLLVDVQHSTEQQLEDILDQESPIGSASGDQALLDEDSDEHGDTNSTHTATADMVTVPYHGGGRSKKINAWYLNTLMVYL